MARNERSSGFVIFRRDGGAPPQFLLLNYGRHWDFPKGHLEDGEDDLTAALRELNEETGIDKARQVPGFRHELSYFFRDRRDHELVRKTVVFFLAEVGWEKIRLSKEHVGFDFLAFDKAMLRLTYATAREMLRRAAEFLQNQSAPLPASGPVSTSQLSTPLDQNE